jgi:hypothetical protein
MDEKRKTRDEYNEKELRKLKEEKQRASVALEIVIIILLVIIIPFCYILISNTETINNGVCSIDNDDVVSLDCNDGNPCTIDVKTLLPTTGCPGSKLRTTTQSCARYACKHIPLSSGACCNSGDFCYHDDPNKQCLLGECVTDKTLCKGYCADDDVANCPSLPFIVDPGSVSMQCINTSCLYTVIVNYYIADPYSLLSQSTSDMSDFNTSSCLTATCSPYGIMGTFFPSLFSICDFAWSCAPYLYPITPLKKRGVDEVAAATTTRNSYQQRFKKFGKDGRPNPPPYSLVAPNPSSLQMINISDPNSIPPVAFPYLSLHDQGVVNRMLFNLKIDAYTHYCASIENQSLQLYTLSL